MKNKSLKLVLAGLSFAFFAAAIGMFALSFLDQVTSGVLNGKASWATGFEIAFGQTKLDSSNTLGTLFAFIFVVVGALAACYGVFYALTAKKSKKSKGNKTAKLICAACTFAICAVIPAVLLFLTKQTTGVGLDINAGILGGTKTTLGIGATLAAIFSLAGGCALSIEEVL